VDEVLNKIEDAEANRASGARNGQVVAVYSCQGGSGATTVAVNLAATMASTMNQKTAVVDLNLQQGMVPVFFGAEPGYTITDVITNQDRLDAQLLKSFLTRITDELYCLPAPAAIHEVEDIQPAHLQRLMTKLRTQFSQIVIDCHRQLDPITMTALDMADTILLVSTQDAQSVYNAKRTLRFLADMGYPVEKIKLVINRFDRSNGMKVEKLEQLFGAPVETTLHNNAEAAGRAMNLGQPMVYAENKTGLNAEFATLARIMMGEVKKVQVARKPSFFEKASDFFATLFGLRPRVANYAVAQA
jgi:pilus assembly protein CpaE